MSAQREFGEIDNAMLAALLFELASQLHIERTRRLALEAALISGGLVTQSKIEAASENAPFRDRANNAADLSVRKLLRVLSDSANVRTPLRDETPITNGEH